MGPDEERYGLDIVEHGMWGYPEQFMPVPGYEYHPPVRARPAAAPRRRRSRLGARRSPSAEEKERAMDRSRR